MFTVFLCISLIVFTAGVVYAISMKKEDRIPWQSFLLILLLFTAIAMWLTVLPLVKEGSFIYKPLYAAFYVLESAVGNVDYSLFDEHLKPISFWRVYTIFLHLLMPFTAYMVILVYFMKAFGWFRYTIFRGKKSIILFSDLTDKSRAYANRISKQKTKEEKRPFLQRVIHTIKDLFGKEDPKKQQEPLLIFCNTEEGEKEHFTEESSRSMIFTDQSELQVLKQLDLHDLTIMEMGGKDDRNLQKSVEIIRYLDEWFGKHKEKEADKNTIHIYTVSVQPEAATILDNIMGRGTDAESLAYRQTVINEYKRIAFKLLHDEPLYKAIDHNAKRLDVLIVGFGRMGQEVLKAVSWAGCFPDTDTNVHVISRRGIENGKRLLSECPELGVDLGHDGGFLNLENGRQLNENAPIYYYSTETAGGEFDEIIRSLVHCRYIIVSLGDDSTTLTAALHIYRVMMRERYLHDSKADAPEIHVHIRDDENLKLFSSDEDRSVFSHFKQFGSDRDIYSENQVGQAEIDHLAHRAHNVYRQQHNQDKDEKTKYDYLPEAKKNANLAAALHVLYKLHFCPGLAIEKVSGKLIDDEWNKVKAENSDLFNRLVSPEERLKLAEWEHIRWQAYMRTEGYVHCPYEQTKKIFDENNKGDWSEAVRETRSQLREARIHPCIGDGETHLKQISQLIGDPKDPYYFHKNDRRFIDSIPEILGGLYRISQK